MKGKTQFFPPPVCLLYYSHHTFHLWFHQSPSMWRFSLTSSNSPQHHGVLYNLTQLWQCLPGDSVISHGLRAQFHKTAPITFQVLIESSKSRYYPQLLSDLGTNQWFPWNPFTLGWLTELKEILRFPSLLKDMKKYSGNNQVKTYIT